MMPSEPIRVMLVDDHMMVRRGLATILQVFDDLELVGEAADGAAAIQLCGDLMPDVILMDIAMPDIDGVMVTRAIRQRFPTVQVLALTSFNEDQMVQNALQAGAIGYLLKDLTADELAEAIRAAHAGRATLSPAALQAMVHATTQPAAAGHDLTERERDVLILMVEGLNNIEIAEKLVVSPSTIKSHVSHILSKLDVTSRTEAVAIAVRHHLAD
jgi:NarL family two-component system response regulator LiaR